MIFIMVIMIREWEDEESQLFQMLPNMTHELVDGHGMARADAVCVCIIRLRPVAEWTVGGWKRSEWSGAGLDEQVHSESVKFLPMDLGDMVLERLTIRLRVCTETARPRAPVMFHLVSVPCPLRVEHEHAAFLECAHVSAQICENMLPGYKLLAKPGSTLYGSKVGLLPCLLAIEALSSVAYWAREVLAELCILSDRRYADAGEGVAVIC